MIYIADAASAARLGLVGDRTAMMARARGILSGPLAADDPARQVVEAIRDASRVAITGAGTLSSLSSVHIIERWVIALLAMRYSVPYVMTGQVFGVELTADDADLLRDLLGHAENVWVRDDASFRLADTLGVAYDHLQLSDALGAAS